MTITPPAPESADIGVIGIGVMGANLARNLARHGHDVAIVDVDPAKCTELITEHGDEGTFIPAADHDQFVQSLRGPRVAIILVPAGDPTEMVIDAMAERMDSGDILVDGGNSFYLDTLARADRLAPTGINFIDTGVSGGAEGALTGPSLMPGGSTEVYERVGPMFESIAARVDGHPCCTHVGPTGSGHFVKMVHNGIEYADMQLISEAYDLLRNAVGLTVPEIRDVFDAWRSTELDSFLIDITTEVLGHTDADTGRPFVDVVHDAAGSKGTGAWSVQQALSLGVPVPAISAATTARALSGAEAQRHSVQALDLPAPVPAPVDDRESWIEAIRQALLASKICAYAQGFHEIATASHEQEWNIDLAELALIWRGGCIIRARFLDHIADALRDEPSLPTLLAAPWFTEHITSTLPQWRRVVALAANSGVATPAFATSLGYLDSLRAGRMPTALIQAQRDHFGSHTYRRTDREGVFHTRWEEDDRPEETWS